MSSTLNTRHSAAVVPRSPALLYPALLIAGIAVIIASMLGLAAMTGLLSPAQSPSVGAKKAGIKTAGGKTAPPAARCTDCGVIDNVRAVEARGDGDLVNTK